MTSTGKLKRENKIIGLQIFINNIYKETVYSRKIYDLKQYAKDNNILINNN